MLLILLFVFLWLIGTIVCIFFMVRCIRFGRKFEWELQQRYPEIVEKRKKFTGGYAFPVRYGPPLENDMIDEELIALKRTAFFSFIGIFLSFGIFLIFSLLLHLI